MGKSIVHVEFSGKISYEFDESGDLLDYELIDKAMEHLAEDPDLCGRVTNYNWKVERI